MQGYFTPPWFPPSWPLMKLSNPASAVTHQGRRHEYHELGGGGEIRPSSDWVPQMIISHNYYTTYGDFILIKLLNKSELGIHVHCTGCLKKILWRFYLNRTIISVRKFQMLLILVGQNLFEITLSQVFSIPVTFSWPYTSTPSLKIVFFGVSYRD